MRLEIAELRTFQAVIETDGFKSAAEQLHISQSAVSQAIANLEAKLELPLIERGKPLVLTDAGRRVLDHANQVLREEAQTLDDLARIKRGRHQLLNLGLSASIN